MIKNILYVLITIPILILFGITLFLLLKIVYFIGESAALAQFIIAEPERCIYINTMAAKEIYYISNASCVEVLLNENHVRYRIGNKTIDLSCGKKCDNLSYIIFRWCKRNNRISLEYYKHLK